MGSARTVPASDIITSVLYELRDPGGTNYNKDGSYIELLGYLNRCNELIYEILVDENAEIVKTGSGSLTTVAGTQNYDLASNGMGDFWLPGRLSKNRYEVWISEYQPMEMCTQDDIYPAIYSNEGSSSVQAMPERFCLIGDEIWFETVPDDAYTVNLRYFPNFVPVSSTSGTMPYKNLFNNDIIEGMKILAKNRNEQSISVDAILKDMFTERALKVTRRRMKKSVSFIPRIK